VKICVKICDDDIERGTNQQCAYQGLKHNEQLIRGHYADYDVICPYMFRLLTVILYRLCSN
jgi:hypothetical protein